MHLRFDAASAVVSAPTLPQGAAQILLRTDRFVSGNRSSARRLARLGILARRDHGTGTSGGNRLVAFTRVICPISCDAADVLIGRDLVQKLWQHGSISDVAVADLDRPNLQCFFLNSNMYFSPDAAFGAAMLAGVPLAFTFGLDICAVDKEVQWTFGASI